MKIASARASARAHRSLENKQAGVVSVITPAFQRREMLRLTLASVHLQDHGAVEHIVMDGGSSDGTVDLLRAAGKRWGIRWVSQPDGGMYEAINRGLDMSHGAVVGWVNSDDWLLPWTCRVAEASIKDHDYGRAVYGDLLSSDQVDQKATMGMHARYNRRRLATVTTLPQPTVFWPAWAGEVTGPLDVVDFRQIADCAYWLRMGEHIEFRKLHEFLAVAVNHPETKRRTLTTEIESEFSKLRTMYRPPRASVFVDRVVNAMSWRSEFAALRAGIGWTESRSSGVLDFHDHRAKRTVGSMTTAALRRHPLSTPSVGIDRYMRRLEEVASELDS